jgi:hypothetical protein
MLRNIQRAIISAYLFDETGELDLLDEYYFEREFKSFVIKINEFIARDLPMSLLNLKLEESLEGHVLESVYLNILIQYPLTPKTMKTYYDYLKLEKRQRLLTSSFNC